MCERSDLQQFSEKTERVIARNKFAAEIMKVNDIPTDNLLEMVKDHPDWTSGDGVHFNGAGNEALTKQVAESVRRSMESE